MLWNFSLFSKLRTFFDDMIALHLQQVTRQQYHRAAAYLLSQQALQVLQVHMYVWHGGLIGLTGMIPPTEQEILRRWPKKNYPTSVLEARLFKLSAKTQSPMMTIQAWQKPLAQLKMALTVPICHLMMFLPVATMRSDTNVIAQVSKSVMCYLV